MTEDLENKVETENVYNINKRLNLIGTFSVLGSFGFALEELQKRSEIDSVSAIILALGISFAVSQYTRLAKLSNKDFYICGILPIISGYIATSYLSGFFKYLGAD